jgi:hypothetical protein
MTPLVDFLAASHDDGRSERHAPSAQKESQNATAVSEVKKSTNPSS